MPKAQHSQDENILSMCFVVVVILRWDTDFQNSKLQITIDFTLNITKGMILSLALLSVSSCLICGFFYDRYISVLVLCQHGGSSWRCSSPHVALLPGDDMKHSGDQEEGAQAHAVHPGSDALPAVVRHTMQQRHAHDGRHDEELQR